MKLLLYLIVALTGLLAFSSCSDFPVTGMISYRDVETGAKGGLVFSENEAPRASVRVPVYDENGKLIGMGEVTGDLARDIDPTK